jgi:hypothetical protein
MTHRVWKHVIAYAMLATVTGCTSPRQVRCGGPSVVHVFRTHIRAGEFHEAYLLLAQVRENLRDVPEDAAGFEYAFLTTLAAINGERQWPQILADPRISLKCKRDLVDEIDEIARRGARLEQ